MRKVEKIVGTAFTRRKTTQQVAETPEEIQLVLQQWAESDFFDDPWAGHRNTVEGAREALAIEVTKQPVGYQFKEREDLGWYLQRLIVLGKLVQHHIDQGSPAWAAHEAVLFGETFCELQMKRTREAEWITGKTIHDAGASSRKGRSRAERVAAVDALCSGPDPIKKTAAFAIVAEREGVTAKAIEADYYNPRKRPKRGD
jgi:hypothetical protein